MQLVERLSETPASVAFGRFRVLPHRRELLADGRPVKLGGRGFDVLMTLIEARGTVLGKEQHCPIVADPPLKPKDVWTIRGSSG